MYDLAIIGNAPVDVLTHVEESYLEKNSLKKGDFNPVDAETFKKIAQECTFEGMEAGGSCANTAWALGKLGKNVYYIGHVGQDPAGKHFYHEMKAADVKMPEPVQHSHTMEIFVLITPDGERTFASRGVTAPIPVEMIQKETFEKSNWLLIEGYTLLDQSDSVLKAVELASQSNCKVAFTISADFVIHAMHEMMMKDILPQTDLFIANDEEFALLKEYIEKQPQPSKVALYKKLDEIDFLITQGEKGATFTHKSEETFAPTTAIQALDATGAGDAFAAGFLYHYIENNIEDAFNLGHSIAGKVITQLGGRLKNWDDIKKKNLQKTA